MNLKSSLATALLLIFSSISHANEALIIEHIHDFERMMPDTVFIEASPQITNTLNETTQAPIEKSHKTYSLPSAAPTITTAAPEVTATQSDLNTTLKPSAFENPVAIDNSAAITINDNADTVMTAPQEVSYGSLWDRVIAGFSMPTMHSPYVQSFEKKYGANPEKFSAIIQRSEKYLFYILEEINKRNMPTEIALIPIIESAYKPNALSRSKALGLWQIMPATGKYFGLKQDWWIDERQNVVDATDVALNYFEKLYARFGSWDLALAAYNAGGGTVGRAIKKNQAQGRPTNYQSLKLRQETRQYVPKMQAVKNIIMNPHLYGMTLPQIDDRPYFTMVNAPAQIDQALVAKLAEITEEEFKALNPNFKRPVIASPNSAHILLLPIHAADTFEYNLSVYDKPLVNWQPYTMHAGETLLSVARQFHINLNSLSKINQLPASLKVRRRLTVLVPNYHDRAYRQSQQHSDSINVISKDISAKQTAKNIHPNVLISLENNHKLFATAHHKSKSSKRKRSKTYIVKRGDTLSRIAKRFRVSIKSIVKRNRIKRNRIKIGQRLKI